MKRKIIAATLCFLLLLTGCGKKDDTDAPGDGDNGAPSVPDGLGDGNTTFGESLEAVGAYDGYFDGEAADITIECISGTQNAYTLEGNTLTFTAVEGETVYSVLGTFKGNIVIDVGDGQKFELELHGLSLVCDTVSPITVNSGDKVTIKAKKDTKNYIYDTRPTVDTADETLRSGAIYSEVDLKISGKGELTVVSENNNGIHSKDDLQVNDLTLLVACVDNSLKGNDSVELDGGNTTLIASGGDCIKTKNSDISKKGNQRGTVSISGGTHTLYAACDGIDAAYDAVIDGDTTVLNIYTDKYSNYSTEVTASSSSEYYIRYTSQKYKYSVKFINSETNACEWVNAEYHSKATGGRSTYYYYAFPKLSGYDKLRFFVYSSEMAQGQEESYAAASDQMTLSTAYDTIALTNSGYSWTNYTTSVQGGGMGGFGGFGGPGGMQDGNTEKGDHSTKGIKAANEIVINAGTVSIKSYDDAIHANNDAELENGASPLGNVTVNGGSITVYSNDDGVHADGMVSIVSGTLSVTESYEGIEGNNVKISGGYISVIARDDGVNATATSGSAIVISGGVLYIYCDGDGIDSNSRTSYSGIEFAGGKTVIISTSGGNSAIDTEQGYKYTAGSVVAVMPRGGMTSEATHCQNFSKFGATKQLSLTSGAYLEVGIGSDKVTVRMPTSMSAYLIVLGDSSPSISTVSSVSVALDASGVAWS